MTDVKVHLYGGIMGAYLGEQTLHTHEADQCAGQFCVIHHPSSHPLSSAPLNYRADRAGLMERRCHHGIGHPDPDDLTFKRLTMPDFENYAFGVHGCDGCCTRLSDAVD